MSDHRGERRTTESCSDIGKTRPFCVSGASGRVLPRLIEMPLVSVRSPGSSLADPGAAAVSRLECQRYQGDSGVNAEEGASVCLYPLYSAVQCSSKAGGPGGRST